MSANPDPLPRLRKIRDLQRRARELNSRRDNLIRIALHEGKPVRQVAEATGLSATRVHEIGDR